MHQPTIISGLELQKQREWAQFLKLVAEPKLQAPTWVAGLGSTHGNLRVTLSGFPTSLPSQNLLCGRVSSSLPPRPSSCSRGIDLNRNFPDPIRDPGMERSGFEQPEVRAVMDWTLLMPGGFTASGALHEGELVVNYPWDGSASGQPVRNTTSDDATFRHLATAYARHNPPMRDSQVQALSAGRQVTRGELLLPKQTTIPLPAKTSLHALPYVASPSSSCRSTSTRVTLHSSLLDLSVLCGS